LIGRLSLLSTASPARAADSADLPAGSNTAARASPLLDLGWPSAPLPGQIGSGPSFYFSQKSVSCFHIFYEFVKSTKNSLHVQIL
jgi:hypothetical protein